MAEYLHFSLTGDLSLLPLWELQSPCCSAVDRLLPANLIWTQQMVHRESGTESSETRGRWKKREREYERDCNQADCQLSEWKWQEKTEVLKVYLHLQRYGLKCNPLPLVSLYHCDCGFLSAQMVCNKLPEKRCKSGVPEMLSAKENARL